MYQTLVVANNIDEFEAARPSIDDLPPGTKIRLRVELPAWAPIGKLADLAGAEWFAQQFAPAQIRVIDVYGDWHWMELTGVAEGSPVLLLITVIVAALSLLGITFFISRIVLEADIPSWGVPALGTSAFLMVAVLGVILLTRR